MKKQKKFVNLERLPTEAEWESAYRAMLKEIKKRKRVLLWGDGDKIYLDNFLDGIFFLLHQSGVKWLKLDTYLVNGVKISVMKYLGNYFNDIPELERFATGWFDGDKEDYSTAEKYFFYPRTMGDVVVLHPDSHTDYKLYIGYTDEIAFKRWKSVEWRILNISLPKFRLEENKKYLPHILNMARGLVEWMVQNN